jgi:hypothetical protein
MIKCMCGVVVGGTPEGLVRAGLDERIFGFDAGNARWVTRLP